MNTKRINLVVTMEELRLLASLASDQLFRRQFIDPKMPGYKGTREDLDLGKAILARMQSLIIYNNEYSSYFVFHLHLNRLD